MSKSSSIPEELIKIKSHQIGRKRQLKGLDGTSESDYIEARQYLEKHRWEVFLWGVKHPDSRDFALDITKTFISAFGLVATIIAGLGIFFTYIDSQQERKEAREELRLTQERLITDRFAKAVEQLGNDKNRTVRIGAIYALERIAKDSPKDHWTIMEVLTSYVRENSPLPPELKQYPKNKQEREQKQKELEKLSRVSIDIQAALTVIGRREDLEPDRDERIDLSFTNLKDANLEGANLAGANLALAIIWRADFSGANLKGTFFGGTQDFIIPWDIKSACFWEEAIYIGTWNPRKKTWVPVEPNNGQFIEQLKNLPYPKELDSKEPTDCSILDFGQKNENFASEFRELNPQRRGDR